SSARLGLTVKRCRPQQIILAPWPHTIVGPVVFRTGANSDEAAALTPCESSSKPQSCRDPIKVLRCIPKTPMRYVPCAMQNMRWSHGCDQLLAFIRIQKIYGMELTNSINPRPSCRDVDVETTLRQRLKRPVSYEAGSARYENGPLFHGIFSSARKSGQPASRSEIMRGSIGHRMANAGSFQRAPRAASGA